MSRVLGILLGITGWLQAQASSTAHDSFAFLWENESRPSKPAFEPGSLTREFPIEGTWNLIYVAWDGSMSRQVPVQTMPIQNCANGLALSYQDADGARVLQRGWYSAEGIFLSSVMIDGKAYSGMVTSVRGQSPVLEGELATDGRDRRLFARLSLITSATQLRSEETRVEFEGESQTLDGVNYRLDPEQARIPGGRVSIGGEKANLLCYAIRDDRSESPSLRAVAFTYPAQGLAGTGSTPSLPMVSDTGERAMMALDAKYKLKSEDPFRLQLRDRKKRGSIEILGE